MMFKDVKFTVRNGTCYACGKKDSHFLMESKNLFFCSQECVDSYQNRYDNNPTQTIKPVPKSKNPEVPAIRIKIVPDKSKLTFDNETGETILTLDEFVIETDEVVNPSERLIFQLCQDTDGLYQFAMGQLLNWCYKRNIPIDETISETDIHTFINKMRQAFDIISTNE